MLSSLRHSTLLNGSAIALAATGAVIMAQPATAATFSFDWDRPDDIVNTSCSTCFRDPSLPLGFNDRIGKYEEVSTTYNDVTGDLTWSSTWSAYNGKTPEGAWLVLTDGPNPKGSANNAIFYMDGLSGTLTAYAYDGNNSRQSYQNQPLLESWDNVVSLVDDGQGNRTISFEANMAALNSLSGLGPYWKGAQYDEHIGIWFHAVEEISDGVVAQYDGDEITAFGGQASWFDTGKMDTETVPVPEPAVGLLGLGVAALALKRRRQDNNVDA